jgi:hypothetical protein
MERGLNMMEIGGWSFRRSTTKAALPAGELAASGSENGYAGSVALKYSRRTVFWFGAQQVRAKVCASAVG